MHALTHLKSPFQKGGHILKKSKYIILRGSTVGQEQQKLNSSLLGKNGFSHFKDNLGRMRILTYT